MAKSLRPLALIIAATCFAVLIHLWRVIRVRATIVANESSPPSFDDSSSSNGTCTDGNPNARDPFDGRRLPSFRREGITIPDWSSDTRECDDFAHPRECALADGYVACFECVESRASLRVCAHLSEPLTVFNESTGESVTLPANSSELYGYCLRERLVRSLRDQRDGGDSAATRRACSARNADWVLVRRQKTGDSTYNFVCRCKYPHLMTNTAGPQSSCSRDVACNGHGRLDEASRAFLVDPFVEGRCVCEDGWVSDYDARAGLGPYCREATFAEWPSKLFRRKRRDDDIELYSRAVDEAFRRTIERTRLDASAEVWLPNPCGECPLRSSEDGSVYYCGDRVETRILDDGLRVLSALFIGVRRNRDFLRGNGGKFPNACLALTESRSNRSVDPKRMLMQFMSQSWNDGSMYAQELGFLVPTDKIDELVSDNVWSSSAYREFVATLVPARNEDALRGFGVLWTYNARNLRENRRLVLESFGAQMSVRKTDLCYPNQRTAWYEFPFYWNQIVVNTYHLLDVAFVEKYGHRFQEIYNCPDERGLDGYGSQIRMYRTETDKETAHRKARGLAPVCFVKHTNSDGSDLLRPEFNCSSDNPTACVLIAWPDIAVYAFCLWYPRDMSVHRWCSTRNKYGKGSTS